MLSLLLLYLVAEPPGILWTACPAGQIVAVEPAGDVDGDGTDDVFAAAEESSGYGITCLSGLTGDTIWHNDSLAGALSTDCFRATADADLDGVADVALATEYPDAVFLLSGASGELIWTAPQDHPLTFVQQSSGPGAGDAAVLCTRTYPGNYCTFFALDGQDGSELWAGSQLATLDDWIRVTDSDVSGNGWSEMGYSMDRGSVMNGCVTARDGYTGEILHSSITMYYGTMDICDSSPVACMAVCSWGDYPSMWLDHLISGVNVWESNDLYFSNLCFTPNITGGSAPYPEVVGWSGTGMTLIRGDDGFCQDSYQFPASIKSFDFFWTHSSCKVALVTSGSFYCPDLEFVSPSIEPHVDLPGGGGCDLCLLDSDLYPTPIAAVAMSAGGCGVCAIRTSWPEGVQEPATAPVNPRFRLRANPGYGGIRLQLDEPPLYASVLDVSGRAVEAIRQTAPGPLFLPLPAGVYHIVEKDTGRGSTRAVVLP